MRKNKQSLTPVGNREQQVLTTPISTGGPDRQSMPTGEFSNVKGGYAGIPVDGTPDAHLARKLSYSALGLPNSQFPNSPKISAVEHLLPRSEVKRKITRTVPSNPRVAVNSTIDNAYEIIQQLADQSIDVMTQSDDYEKITTLAVSIEKAQRIYKELLSSAAFKQNENYQALKIQAQHSGQVAGENDPHMVRAVRDQLVKKWKEDTKALEAKTIELKISNNPHLRHLDGVIRKAQIMSYMGGNGNKSEAESNRLLGQLEKNLRILPKVKIPSHVDKSWYINTVYKEMAQILQMPDDRSDNMNPLRKSLMEMEIIHKFGRVMMDNPEQVVEFNARVEKFNEDYRAKSSAANPPQQIQQPNNSAELESLKLRLAELEQANETLQNQNRGFEELLRQEQLKAKQAELEASITNQQTISNFQQKLINQKEKLLKDFERQTKSMREEITMKTGQVNALHVELARLEFKEPEFKEVLNKTDAETQAQLSKEPGVEMGINTDENNIDKFIFVEEEKQIANEILEKIPNKITADANTQTWPHQLNVEELNCGLKFENLAAENKFRHALWKVVEHNQNLAVNDSNSFEEFWRDIRNLSLPDRKAITKFALKRDEEARNPEDIKQIFTVINQFIEVMGPEKMTKYLEGFRDENGTLRSQKKTSMPIVIITDSEGNRPVNNPTSYLESPIGVQLKAVVLQR